MAAPAAPMLPPMLFATEVLPQHLQHYVTAYQNANVLSGHDKRLIDSFTNTRQETNDKKMNKINNNNFPPCPAGLR